MTTRRADELRRRLIRNVDEAPLERQTRLPLYDSLSGRLSDGTAATKLGASVDRLAPGMRSCPYHFHHAQEELFVVLEGEGSLRVAGELVPVKAGDVVFIPPGPEYPHQFVNTSAAPMKYLSVSTQEEPEICEYPDSGKYVAWSRELTTRNRAKDNLDYWADEP